MNRLKFNLLYSAGSDHFVHALFVSLISLPQDTVSVHRPGFYADRFFKFMSSMVFKKSSCEFITLPYIVTQSAVLEEAQARLSFFFFSTAEPRQKNQTQ